MRRRIWLCPIVAGLLSAGCVMVIGVPDAACDWPCKKRVVQIDGEMYVVDLTHHRVRKLKKGESVPSESTTTVETTTEGK